MESQTFDGTTNLKRKIEANSTENRTDVCNFLCNATVKKRKNIKDITGETKLSKGTKKALVSF